MFFSNLTTHLIKQAQDWIIDEAANEELVQLIQDHYTEPERPITQQIRINWDRAAADQKGRGVYMYGIEEGVREV